MIILMAYSGRDASWVRVAMLKSENSHWYRKIACNIRIENFAQAG